MREHGPTPPSQKGDGRGVGERSKTNRTYPGVQSGKDGANGKEVVILTKGDHGVGAAPCSGGRGRVRCRSLGRWSTLEVLWVKPVGSGCCERKSLHNVGMASRSGARRPFICPATTRAFSTWTLSTWGKRSVLDGKPSRGSLGMNTKTLGYAGVGILVAPWMPSLMVHSALPSQEGARRCPRARGSGGWTATASWWRGNSPGCAFPMLPKLGEYTLSHCFEKVPGAASQTNAVSQAYI